jgi:hypothetical protein
MDGLIRMGDILGEERVGGFIDAFVFPESDLYHALSRIEGLYRKEFKTAPKVRLDVAVKDGDIGLMVTISPVPKNRQEWLSGLFETDRDIKALGKKMSLEYDGAMAHLVPTGRWTVTRF